MPVSFINILITVSLTIAVLIIYRQLDRNNRSLEKVKRYSDLVKKNLAEFVESKTTEIKDLGIDLQVNLKTGTEILNRIKKMRDDLREKSGDVEIIQGKVRDYDTVLKELISITTKVEENLKRIHSESGFVDHLGKRIKGASLQIQQIEKQMPEILNHLNETNRERLEKTCADLETSMEDRVEVVQDTLTGIEEKVNDYSTYITKLESRRDRLEAETMGNLEKMSETIVLKAKEAEGEIIDKLQDNLSEIFDSSEAKLAELTEKLEGMVEKSEEHMQNTEQGHVKKLNDFDSDLAEIEDNYKKRLENAAQRGGALEHEAFQSLKERFERDMRKFQEVIESNFKNLDEKIKSGQKDLVELFGHTRSDVTVWQAEIDKQMKDSIDQMENNKSEAGRAMESVFDELELHKEGSRSKMEEARKEIEALRDNLSSEIEDIEIKTVEIVEKRLEDYEGDANYRFNKLEQVNLDIVLLEKNLRDLMEKIASGIKMDFETFTNLLEEKRNNEKQRTSNVIEKLRRDMDELEQGLAALKTKAYQDVSEKLQGFEDEFLADLSERSKGMEQTLSTWQENISTQIDQIAESHMSERKELEDKYKENLVAHMSRLDEEYSGELASVQKDLENRLSRMAQDLESGQKGLKEQLYLAEQEVSKWKERLEQELDRAKLNFNDRFVVFTDEVETTVGSLKEEFNTQRDELIVQTREERANLEKELSDISARIIELKKHLSEKTESTFELFKKRQDEFEIEFKLKSQDLRSNIEEQIRDFKGTAGSMREKAGALQDKLFGKIEDGYKWLSEKLASMEKQQKHFVSQTKLFDRADKLKLDLERNIGELRKNLTILEPQRKDMRLIDGEFKNTRKLVEEVASKLTRFQAERRRTDDLEKNFDRLIGLSQSIDIKLASVTTSHDTIEQVQIKIRELEQLIEQVESRYDRLDKKKDILDTTTEGLEKSFKLLSDLENRFKTVSAEFKDFPDQVKEIGQRIDFLTKNKDKVDSAIEKAELLKEILDDVENRMTKLQTAREWLAKTETRLETIGKQAQDQIKLLKTLAKAEAEHNRDSGAPTKDKRETVLQLAKMGWSSKEIAQRINLSRGEVELILELAPQRK